jgi:hypothetical protein
MTPPLRRATHRRHRRSTRVLVLFSVLLFVKAFHWLAQARVEHIEQTDGHALATYLRLFCLQVRHSAIALGARAQLS